ncbi:MAG: hypothetical protein HQL25_07100 [Candidatus Omnitrophica bacterium]|nr:hypothetical protein [Candidatus Omnitrophota bacterium]
MKKILFSILVHFLVCVFILTNTTMPVFAQTSPILPPTNLMLHLTKPFAPAQLIGLQLDEKNALRMNFFVSKGDKTLESSVKQEEYNKLIKYFLASLTIPDDNQWVNLSPYEKNRIIASDFGDTDMGRDLLSQDYLLKQLTSSLIYPEDETGRAFWDMVYKKVYEKYGKNIEIPIDTFNKVWIVPEKAVVYERNEDRTVWVLESKLKVMLEKDYEAAERNMKSRNPLSSIRGEGQGEGVKEKISTLSITEEVVREIVLPLLEKEVNEGKHFAMLRQIYSAMILSTWYKKNLKESLLGKGYMDKSKTYGVELQEKGANEAIYQKYVEAFKTGLFNYVKEEYDPVNQQIIPRKYFSGGFDKAALAKILQKVDYGMFTNRAGDVEKISTALTEPREANLSVWSKIKRTLLVVAIMAALSGCAVNKAPENNNKTTDNNTSTSVVANLPAPKPFELFKEQTNEVIAKPVRSKGVVVKEEVVKPVRRINDPIPARKGSVASKNNKTPKGENLKKPKSENTRTTNIAPQIRSFYDLPLKKAGAVVKKAGGAAGKVVKTAGRIVNGAGKKIMQTGQAVKNHIGESKQKKIEQSEEISDGGIFRALRQAFAVLQRASIAAEAGKRIIIGDEAGHGGGTKKPGVDLTFTDSITGKTFVVSEADINVITSQQLPQVLENIFPGRFTVVQARNPDEKNLTPAQRAENLRQRAAEAGGELAIISAEHIDGVRPEISGELDSIDLRQNNPHLFQALELLNSERSIMLGIGNGDDTYALFGYFVEDKIPVVLRERENAPVLMAAVIDSLKKQNKSITRDNVVNEITNYFKPSSERYAYWLGGVFDLKPEQPNIPSLVKNLITFIAQYFISFIIQSPEQAVPNYYVTRPGDKAELPHPSQIPDQASNVGGIDLKSSYLDMVIKRDKYGVPLPFNLQDARSLDNLPGLKPLILEISSVSDSFLPGSPR